MTKKFGDGGSLCRRIVPERQEKNATMVLKVLKFKNEKETKCQPRGRIQNMDDVIIDAQAEEEFCDALFLVRWKAEKTTLVPGMSSYDHGRLTTTETREDFVAQQSLEK